MSERAYVYVFIRLDLPRDQRIIQAVHAALRAGALFYSPDLDELGEPTLLPRVNVVLIGVKNEASLVEAFAATTTAGIEAETFREPDLDNSLTAFATRLLVGEERAFFSKFKLYGAGTPP